METPGGFDPRPWFSLPWEGTMHDADRCPECDAYLTPERVPCCDDCNRCEECGCDCLEETMHDTMNQFRLDEYAAKFNVPREYVEPLEPPTEYEMDRMAADASANDITDPYVVTWARNYNQHEEA